MSLKEPTLFLWDDRLTKSDKKLVGDLNVSLDRLSGLRAVEINVSGKFARSKIAWKLATYQHLLLHRLVGRQVGSGAMRTGLSRMSYPSAASRNGNRKMRSRDWY